MERNHKTYVNLKEYDNTLYANVEDLKAEWPIYHIICY